MAEWFAEKIINGSTPLGTQITLKSVEIKIRKMLGSKRTKEADRLIESIKTILISKGRNDLI